MLKKFKKVVKYSTYKEEHIVNVSGNGPKSILIVLIEKFIFINVNIPSSSFNIK